MYLHCPECGFQNPEAARFCEKCGGALTPEESVETTIPFHVEQEEGRGTDGVSILIRSGGGRGGEAFLIEEAEITVGRSPECDIFLDDVTVSREHARLLRRPGGIVIEDRGSLNGTFVNRQRVDVKELEDGDEIQIGKYKLTFLER